MRVGRQISNDQAIYHIGFSDKLTEVGPQLKQELTKCSEHGWTYRGTRLRHQPHNVPRNGGSFVWDPSMVQVVSGGPDCEGLKFHLYATPYETQHDAAPVDQIDNEESTI